MLAALRLVERTGEGQVVDASLLATAAWTMSTDLSSTLVDGNDPPVLGRTRKWHALQESYRTADDRWVLLFMPEPHWWPRFCEAVGRPEWAHDPRYETVAPRREHMPEIVEHLDALFAERTLAEWGALIDEHGFTWAPAATVVGVRRRPARLRGRPVPGGRAPDGRAVPDGGHARARAGRRHRAARRRAGPGPAHRRGARRAGADAEQVEALAADGVVGLGP